MFSDALANMVARFLLSRDIMRPWSDQWPTNVWLGTTTEDQERFDQRWPHLRAVAAKRRFISYEPAIGPLRLDDTVAGTILYENGWPLDWVISGGEFEQI